MFATLTSTGQLTLPKNIRDRLNLNAGAILDFQIQPDNTIIARHVQPDARCIRGLQAALEQDRHLQLIAIRSLLEEPAFAFEDREAVAAALTQFEMGSCGFADCLVVAKHARQRCDLSATFDRGMRKLPGVKVL